MNYKSIIADMVSAASGIPAADAYAVIKTNSDAAMGDFAFPCFRLAGPLRKAPPAIAAEIAAKLPRSEHIDRVSADGPYVNFFVDKAGYAESVVTDILAKGASYGSGTEGAGKTVLIDYSSPNVTHEFHIGHLFSTVIGAAIYRTYKYLGYHTVGINYIGDWGTQFGKLLFAYKEWSTPEALETGGLEELTRVYVKFHAESEVKPELKSLAREWQVKLETGDAEAVELWKRFVAICLASMERTYKRLGVTFDSYKGESYYNGKMAAVVDEIAAKGLLVESEGAHIVDLSAHKMPACLILRSDGGTLYPTRDIAAAFDRKNEYDFYKSLYVTDMRQSLHFAQFFKVIELMGYEWASDMVHIPYGLLSLETGPLQSRTGNIILLNDLFDEAARRILRIINEKNSGLPDKEQVAEDVGVGAVVFGVLYTSRIKDLVFSWDKQLNFDGETGPYVQYTHARACSVLQKAGVYKSGVFTDADYGALTDDASFALIKALAQFPERIRESADKYEPFILSRALVGIAQGFNKFYHDNHVLSSADDVKQARLALVDCVRVTLMTGLNLLGIKAPEQM